METIKNQVIDIIKENELRLSRSRLAVLDILIKYEDRFLTPEEIYKDIIKTRSINCDQTSIYRNLKMFHEIGVVKKSEFQQEASRYSLNREFNISKKDHEHFFKCTSCGKIEPFSDCIFSKKEKELINKGYRNLHHHIEITGICPTCDLEESAWKQ